MMHKKRLRRYFSPQTLASQGVLAEKSSPRLCILCRNVHNRGLQQPAATSGLQTGCLGLCRIAIYQVANERAGHGRWPQFVTPVHVACFACSGRIRRIFFAARVASDKAGRARWARAAASGFGAGLRTPLKAPTAGLLAPTGKLMVGRSICRHHRANHAQSGTIYGAC